MTVAQLLTSALRSIAIGGLLALLLFPESSAFAANPKGFGRFGLGLTYLSGEKHKSLGSPNSQISLQFEKGRGNDWYATLLKFRLDTSSGTANFLDGSTSKSIGYTEISGVLGLGFRVSPIPTTREKGVLLYVGASANVGFAQLQLASGQTYTNLTATQTAMTLGYDLYTGVELILGQAKNPWGFFVQVELKNQKAKLANQSNFDLGGLMILGGVVW